MKSTPSLPERKHTLFMAQIESGISEGGALPMIARAPSVVGVRPSMEGPDGRLRLAKKRRQEGESSGALLVTPQQHPRDRKNDHPSYEDSSFGGCAWPFGRAKP